MSSDVIAITETVKEFLNRKGTVKLNRDGRVTTGTLSNPTEKQCGYGYVAFLGTRRPKPTMSVAQLLAAIRDAHPTELIKEVYPTKHCVGCGGPSWNFALYEARGHSTCKKCGTVNKIAQENVGSWNLGDDGKAMRHGWNFTPGMTHHDTECRKNGKIHTLPGQRIPARQREHFARANKIDAIADSFHFDAAECIGRQAKTKNRMFYRNVHGKDDTDDVNKMPHGKATFAAACFYAAVLEFEKRHQHKTPCSLPAIQEVAQAHRDHKNGRATRDVTIIKIIEYIRKLKDAGLCNAPIPHPDARTLSFHPKSSAVAHARMAIFNGCKPTTFYLPTRGPWGITLEDTEHGVLVFGAVKSSGAAFAAGVRKGDYMFRLNKTVVDCDMSSKSFKTWAERVREQESKKTVIEVTIMRKKKSSV